ncbi:MAG: MFS transporter, partial [Ilumatobacteraceae bacterium]
GPSWLTTGRGRPFRALAHHQFRVVWGTFVIGQLGFWIAFLTLQTLMVDLTDGDGRWVGLLFFCNFIPILIFTPLAGLLADRYERRIILVCGFAAMTLVATSLSVVTFAGLATPLILLPFAFAIGTVFAFKGPADQGLIANIVPSADLPSAISLHSVGGNLSRVIGPTIAAPILVLSSQNVAFVLFAGSSLAVFVILARSRLHANVRAQESGGFFERLKGGLVYARQRPPALAALSMLAVSSLTAGAYFSILPLVASDVFDRGSVGLTTLAAVSGVGSVIGAIATGSRDSAPTLASTTTLVALFGASFVAFGLMPTWPLALVASVLLGGFYFWAMTTINALLQSLVEDAYRGRVMALFMVGWAGLIPIGALWQGLFAEAFGTRSVIVVGGTIVAVYAVATLLLARRSVPVAD